MPFESLAYRHKIMLDGLPDRWLPLIHLYDPDLPLFPIYYFHVLPEGIPLGQIPNVSERAYGYVQGVNLSDGGASTATVVTNKDLTLPSNAAFLRPVLNAVRDRFGLNDPVTQQDVANCFRPPLDAANRVLVAMWQRVIADAYGGRLPFGRLWDEVLGLTRFVASWNSDGGRKGELIQTHYFASRFGERIQSAGANPQLDFFLLPSITELLDPTNPLVNFPGYAHLVNIAEQFRENYCEERAIDTLSFSAFTNPRGGRFDTDGLMEVISTLPFGDRPRAIECYNSFNKGPQRTVMFLMMLADLRRKSYDPASLTSGQCGELYDGMKGTYQSPKAIQIYAQQCFGNIHAMPVDTWIDTFLKWPLAAYSETPVRGEYYKYVFDHSATLGKVERLLWIAGQARKVHSSACDDALWCLKKSSNGHPRGANPLACNGCRFRSSCVAYGKIKNHLVGFNSDNGGGSVQFQVFTSEGNNVAPNQSFVRCIGNSIYEDIDDDFSPMDNPSGFAPFPDSSHGGKPIPVEEFVRIY